MGRAPFHTKQSATLIGCELESESEGKRKSAVTFVIALFFLVAGTRLSSISFRMDVIGGLTRKSSERVVNFFTLVPHTHSERKAPDLLE